VGDVSKTALGVFIGLVLFAGAVVGGIYLALDKPAPARPREPAGAPVREAPPYPDYPATPPPNYSSADQTPAERRRAAKRWRDETRKSVQCSQGLRDDC
jgi:uncharacterized membrane protein